MSIFVKIFRWIARILGIIFILLILTFTLTEEIRSFSEMSAPEYLMTFALLCVIIGIITAWKWEGISGTIILIAFAVFWIVNIVTSGQYTLGPILPLAPLVGFLHWYCANREKSAKRTK